jgi:hypothetical protein
MVRLAIFRGAVEVSADKLQRSDSYLLSQEAVSEGRLQVSGGKINPQP